MVLVQQRPFFQLFFLRNIGQGYFPTYFLGNISQKNVFYDILERKNAVLGYKNKKLKRGKIEIFSKGPKIAIISTFFFLRKIGQENVFYDILERKNGFLGYKNKKFKKSKNCRFSNFFFRQYRPEKCVLRYSRTKKRLSRV